MENCRRELQARLVKQDKILSLLATKISGTLPTECRERYREQKRLRSIESTSYFAQREGDRIYRIALTKEIQVMDSVDKTLDLDYELTGQDALQTPIDSAKPKIDLVKGYTNITGGNNK